MMCVSGDPICHSVQVSAAGEPLKSTLAYSAKTCTGRMHSSTTGVSEQSFTHNRSLQSLQSLRSTQLLCSESQT